MLGEADCERPSNLPAVRDRIHIPEHLVQSCSRLAVGADWLRRLPTLIGELVLRWSLVLDSPFDGASAAWVAPVRRADGSSAVLKVGLPHMEGEHEIDGLRFWDGDPTVRLLDADDANQAMLLERCEPGSDLRELPEPRQDEVIAVLLRRLWHRPPGEHPFPSLSDMIRSWGQETTAHRAAWSDRGLVEAGLQLLEELSRSSNDDDQALLATDLHAGNVLRAQREPWLVIDPKPFVGDRSYDATQHLFNCESRVRVDPLGTIEDFSGLLDVSAERVLHWMFARSAAEPRDEWNDESLELARTLEKLV
jgi:streptomycin 6-kinase